MKPNFLIIGAARSGTTSLFQYLDPHPQVYMSQVKELNFFSNDKYWRKGFEWYESRFSGADSKTVAVGEASTSYTKAPFTDDVPKRIFDYNPDMKIIYIIREPIERYISHYMKRVQNGIETRTFEDTLLDLRNEPSAWQGLYYYQIKKYQDLFPRKQILVLTMEDLKRDLSGTVGALYSFLEIEPLTLPTEKSRAHNATTKVVRKSKQGQKLLNFYRNHIEQTRIPFFMKRTIAGLADIQGVEIEKPILDSESQFLLEDFYREDKKNLYRDLGITFSSKHTQA